MQITASNPCADAKPEAHKEEAKAEEQEAVQPTEEEKEKDADAPQESPKATDYQCQLFPLISFIKKDE